MFRQRLCGVGLCRVLALAAVAAIVLLATGPAMATVITLTGGDSTDGWVAPSTVTYAYDFSASVASPPTYVMQGVTFTPAAEFLTGHPVIPGTGLECYGGADWPDQTYGGSANDIALGRIQDTVIFPHSKAPDDPIVPGTVTLSSLTSGQAYRVDLFVYCPGDRDYAFKFNGVAGDSFTGAAAVGYVVEQMATADSAGKILIEWSRTSANPPTWGGVCVSPIPEPAGIVLLSTGLLGLLAYAWRRRR